VLGYELMRRFIPVIVERLQATRLSVLDIYGHVRPERMVAPDAAEFGAGEVPIFGGQSRRLHMTFVPVGAHVQVRGQGRRGGGGCTLIR
jgi:hypothetical protein